MKKTLKAIIASTLITAMTIGTGITACAAPKAAVPAAISARESFGVPTAVTPGGVIVYNYYQENDMGTVPTAYPAEYLLAIDAAGITNEMTDYEKCVRINNYICAIAEYEWEDIQNLTYSGQSGMEIFKHGKAVCAGYTHAFHTMASMLNIDNTMQTSIQMLHAWNKVTIDGTVYYVDVTWNDTAETDDYLMSPALWADHMVPDIIEYKGSMHQAPTWTTNESGIEWNIPWEEWDTIEWIVFWEE